MSKMKKKKIALQNIVINLTLNYDFTFLNKDFQIYC